MGLALWNDDHGHGVAMNSFLAWQARRNGLVEVMREHRGDWDHPMSETEIATTMEAIFGAVDTDSGQNLSSVREVMTRLGVFWPHYSERWKLDEVLTRFRRETARRRR